MYVGTNDKDTYTQLISTEQAIDILDENCLKYLDGYTIQAGYERWTDEKVSKQMKIQLFVILITQI